MKCANQRQVICFRITLIVLHKLASVTGQQPDHVLSERHLSRFVALASNRQNPGVWQFGQFWQMFAAQKAMRQAERGEGGDAPQGLAADRTPRSGRLFRAAGRMVLANQKLVKAQAKTGITSLNEYTGQQSNFIASGQMSAEGPLVGSRLAGLGSSLARRFGGRRAAPADLQDLNAENEQLPPPQGPEVEQDVQDQQQEGVGGDSEPDQKPDERQIPAALFDVEKPQPIAGISDGDANLTDADLQMARAMKMNGRSEE